jgi:prolyl oligopeptidase PreP (S9A serine peptidase family)
MEWKWTYGEKYEKSMRVPKEKKRELMVAASKESEDYAITQSLFSEEESWIMEKNIQQKQGMLLREPNQRESTYSRMSEREMYGQIGMNPFLSNNNYANDLSNQEQFMKPQSTTIDRVKGNQIELEQ